MHLSQTVPALPVRSITNAVECYVERLGFTAGHVDPDGFAVVVRDDAEIHLWQSGDDGWPLRPTHEFVADPVCTGAETFLAGTASCRIRVDELADVDLLHAELATAGALHPTDAGAPVDTDYGTREFAALDDDGNLLTFFARR